MSLKIYFLRHGETTYSDTGAYCGEVDAELTPEGAQMAEAFAHMHGEGRVEAFSAGSRPSGRINPKAIEAMKECGYDLSTHSSKGLADFNRNNKSRA